MITVYHFFRGNRGTGGPAWIGCSMALKARLSIPTSGLMEAVHLPPVLWGLRKKCSELLISYLIQQNVMGIFRVPLITPPQKVRPYYSKGLFSGTMMGFITAENFQAFFRQLAGGIH